MKKALALFLALTITGCTTVMSANQQGATTEGVMSVVESNNEFAIDFYHKIRSGDEGNLFFSPYSLSTALAMTYEGARGETRDEIQEVFHFMEDDALRRPSTGMIYNLINTPRAKYTISTANALWVQEEFPVKEDYLKLIKDYYVGEATNLDFVERTEESRVRINNWVEGHTNNKIKNILPPGTLTALTRLVLTNAVHFKGYWEHQFSEDDTISDEFDTGNEVVTVPIMRLTDSDLTFNYTEDERVQVLELAYKGGDLSMMLILPKNDSLTVLEEELTNSELSDWRSNLTPAKVYIYLPRFTFETKYFLSNELKEMGMPTAFTDSANFSGISSFPLMIDDVIHQGFVEVNEEGTEAAAATAVVIALTSTPIDEPKIFRADHPFIFLIQERSTGAIVFMGRVVNPLS